jgi:hypothetical protein
MHIFLNSTRPKACGAADSSEGPPHTCLRGAGSPEGRSRDVAVASVQNSGRIAGLRPGSNAAAHRQAPTNRIHCPPLPANTTDQAKEQCCLFILMVSD